MQIAMTVALIVAIVTAAAVTAWTGSVISAGLLCALGILSIVWTAMQADGWWRVRALFAELLRSGD
jgi:hypothetical protein